MILATTSLKRLSGIIGILAVALLLSACGITTEPEMVSGQPPASGDILFRDDFSATNNGWGTWKRKSDTVNVEMGGMRILIEEPNFDFWSVAGQQFGDAVIDVDARLLAGPTDNDFGIICRYQDNQNFYMFLVSSDGYYGIAKLKDDQHSLIGIEQLQYSDKIQPSQVAHQLHAECVGNVLRFAVDGTTLLEVRDDDFKQGDVGVIAGAYSQSGVDILFDNYVVRQP